MGTGAVRNQTGLSAQGKQCSSHSLSRNGNMHYCNLHFLSIREMQWQGSYPSAAHRLQNL